MNTLDKQLSARDYAENHVLLINFEKYVELRYEAWKVKYIMRFPEALEGQVQDKFLMDFYRERQNSVSRLKNELEFSLRFKKKSFHKIFLEKRRQIIINIIEALNCELVATTVAREQPKLRDLIKRLNGLLELISGNPIEP